MKKLFDNDPGSLKHTFENLESIPSFELWKGMEPQLSALNRRKKIKRRIRGFAFVSSICIGILIWLLLPSEPRMYFPYGGERRFTANNQGPEFPVLTLVTPISEAPTSVAGSAQIPETHAAYIPAMEITAFNTAEEQIDESESVATAFLGIQRLSTTLKDSDIPILEMKPIAPVVVFSDKFEDLAAAGKKPELFIRGGLDAANGNGLYAPVKSYQNNAFASPMSSKGPYDYKLPQSFSAGILKPFGPCFSVFGGLTYTVFRGEATTAPRKGSYAAVKSRATHLGVIAGARLNIVNNYALKPFLSGGFNISFAPGVHSRITDYSNGQVVHDRVEFMPTQSLFAAAIGSVGMSYILNDKVSIQLEVQSLKPIKNYRNEMNLYGGEAKYLLGSRLGVFVSL